MLGRQHVPDVRNETEKMLLREIETFGKSTQATLTQLQQALQLLSTYQKAWVQLLGCRRSNLMSLIPLTSQRLDQLTAAAKTLAGTLHAKINPLQQLLYRLEVFASVNASTAAELQQAAPLSQLVADKSALATFEQEVLKEMKQLVATCELHVTLAVTCKQQQPQPQQQLPLLHTSAAPAALLNSHAANLQLSHLQHVSNMTHDPQHRQQNALQHNQQERLQQGLTQQQLANPSQQQLVQHKALLQCRPASQQPADLPVATNAGSNHQDHVQQHLPVDKQKPALHHNSFSCWNTDPMAMLAPNSIQQTALGPPQGTLLVQHPKEGPLATVHGYKAHQQQQQPQRLQDVSDGVPAHAVRTGMDGRGNMPGFLLTACASPGCTTQQQATASLTSPVQGYSSITSAHHLEFGHNEAFQHQLPSQQQQDELQGRLLGTVTDHAQQGMPDVQPGQAGGKEPPCSEAVMGQHATPAADSSARCGHTACGGSQPRHVHARDPLSAAALS